jgi:arginyl-tRNA synthetase
MLSDLISLSVQKAADTVSASKKIITLSHPETSVHGDFSCSIALQLAKELKQPPLEIAKKIADLIDKEDLIEKIEVLPPGFINIFIKPDVLLKEARHFATLETDKHLSETNSGKEAIVEYSSPNIAKPFTIGHLRSTIIGDAVANLLEATGYKVYRDNHLGDWGTQFGKQIYAIKHIGENNEQMIESSERPIAELVKLYVKFHEEAEKDPSIEDKAREYFKQLEDGDPEMRRLWQRCIEWSFKEFDTIYKKLGVSFTENKGRGYGESFFEDKMDEVLKELESKLSSDYKENKNAKLIYFPDDKYPPLMIIKQDGATLYSTRDLATDNFRKTNYPNVSLIINEVGAEQSLYFQQLYEVEKMLGWFTDDQRVHVKHGMYRFKDMKMSTRKGNVIWLEDVLEEARKKALELTKDGTDSIADIVSIGALKWNDLKRSSHLDIVFDWNDMLSMQGNSGPYMQYAYVRTLSVLNKAGSLESLETNPESLNEDDLLLLKQFYKYPEVVELAAKNYAPHLLTTYLYELAQAFSTFYQKNPILKADPSEKNNRLLITKATSNIIKHGLSLLGMQTVEKM